MDGRALGWRFWSASVLAGAAVVAAALTMPVRVSETVANADPSVVLPDAVVEAAPEDLGAFLAIRRWGAPPEEEKEPAPPEEAAPALNPVLAEMGFVGLIAVQDELAVLLALPEGDIVRMLPGDTLPDGRTLVSVSDNSLTLAGAGQPEEVLTLFPRLPAEAAPVPAPGDLPDGAETAPSGASGETTVSQ